jgi:hypothetical protein
MGYLTQEDVQNFGPELIDFSQRAAVHAVAPHLQHLEEQNAELRNRLARTAKRMIDQALDQAIPNWQEINNDPRFHQWLRESDPYSRVARQRLLNEAVEREDANRVIRFFQGFISELTGAAPLGPSRDGQPRPAATGQRIYTRPQITKMADLRRKGKIDDQAWARWENELCLASKEGRILNPVRLDGSA